MKQTIEFKIHGIDMIKKKVTGMAGHSSVLYLPKQYLNKTVVVIQLDDLPEDVEKIELPDLTQQARKVTRKKPKEDEISDEELDKEFSDIMEGSNNNKGIRRL